MKVSIFQKKTKKQKKSLKNATLSEQANRWIDLPFYLYLVPKPVMR